MIQKVSVNSDPKNQFSNKVADTKGNPIAHRLTDCVFIAINVSPVNKDNAVGQ